MMSGVVSVNPTPTLNPTLWVAPTLRMPAETDRELENPAITEEAE